MGHSPSPSIIKTRDVSEKETPCVVSHCNLGPSVMQQKVAYTQLMKVCMGGSSLTRGCLCGAVFLPW